MNEEERLVLKGYELALTGMGDRLTDIARVYKVLNDSHIDTQVQLAEMRKTTEFIYTEQARLADSQEEYTKSIGALTVRFNEFETSAKTVVSIFKWVVTPAMVLNILYTLYRWVSGLPVVS